MACFSFYSFIKYNKILKNGKRVIDAIIMETDAKH